MPKNLRVVSFLGVQVFMLVAAVSFTGVTAKIEEK